MRSRWTLLELERLVTRLRKRWGIEIAPLPDLLRILTEVFPKEFPGFKLLVVPDDNLPYALAVTDSDANTITVGARVAAAAKRLEKWALYVLAEEIGHYILKHPGVRCRKPDGVSAYATTSPKVGADEREAKRFASVLLAPEYLAKNCTTIEELQQKFPLSKAAAKLRLDELDETRRREKGLTRQPPQVVDDLLKHLAIKGRNAPAQDGRRFDLEIELNGPAEGAAPIVDIEQSSSTARCVVWGYAHDGGLVNVEIRGSEKGRLLPFARNKIFVKFLSGGPHLKIVAVDWREFEPAYSPMSAKSMDYATSRGKGYTGDACTVCTFRTLLREANSLRCDSCGWADSDS